MAKRFDLGDLRAAIEESNRQVMAQRGNGEAPNSEVLSLLKRDRASLISHFTPQLIDIALIKLLNEVCSRKRSQSISEGSIDLFEGLGKIPESVTVARGLKKDTAKLTIAEARNWIELHSRRVVQGNHRDFEILVAKCEKFIENDNETIEDALTRMRAEQWVQVKQLELAG